MNYVACKKCGAKVSDQYSFCSHCLSPISTNGETRAETEEDKSEARAKTPVTHVPAVKSSRSRSHSSLVGWLLSPIEKKRIRKPRRKIPSDTRQGALVGGFVGFLCGIFYGSIFYFVMLPPMMQELIARLSTDPRIADFVTSLAFRSLFNTIMILVVVLLGILSAPVGGVLGVLFVALEKRIPGKSITRKAMLFSCILWGIEYIPGIVSRLLYPLDEYAKMVERIFPVSLYPISILVYGALGYVFGYLLDRRLRPG